MLEGLRHLVSADRPALDILRDVLDIVIVAFLTYRTLLVLKGTRAMQMGLGVVVFGGLYLVAKHAELATLLSLLSWIASSAILIVVVMFQNDIRRALIRVGSKAWHARGRDAQERVVDEVVAAATELARHRMGALLCLERDANVLEFVKSEGIDMDAAVTRELLVSLFIPEAVNKTHDGAVLIRDLKIARAGVFFPLPETTKVADPTFGSRHRAAIGITEETDAVVVVVSEERGTITLCFSNGIVPNIDAVNLKATLLGLFAGTEKRRQPLGDRLVLAPASEPVSPSAAAPRASGRAEPVVPSSPPPTQKPPQSATARSGQFQPLRRHDEPSLVDLDRTRTPAPVRVSVPMPSPKDRPADEPAASPAEVSAEAPSVRPSVTVPMAPTELPHHTPLRGDDS